MTTRRIVQLIAAVAFGLLGVIQLCITRRFVWADVFFILVALGLVFGWLPIINKPRRS